MEIIFIYILIMTPVLIIGLLIFALIMKYTKTEQTDNGSINQEIICPHCQTKGYVRTKRIIKKSGISGSKVMGAIITGGISMLATGLSNKDEITQAYCGKCKSKWHF